MEVPTTGSSLADMYSDVPKGLGPVHYHGPNHALLRDFDAAVHCPGLRKRFVNRRV